MAKVIVNATSTLTNPNLPSTWNVPGEGEDSGGGFNSCDAVLGEGREGQGKCRGRQGREAEDKGKALLQH